MESKTFIYSNSSASYDISSQNKELYIDSYPIINGSTYTCDSGYHILSRNGEKAVKFNESAVSFEEVPKTPSTLQALGTNNASFSVLETNPKITGNIKVVIDSNENIFIDTFKVNDTLSKKKYRKVPVSYKDYYGKNIMSIFRNMSSDDIYNISKKYYDIVTTTTKLSEQFVDTYRSGVSTNSDNLYKENFSALAPLYIKDILPDFFVIFKVDGLVDMPDSSDIMKYLIKNGEQIKCFDLRQNSKLGTYIRNIQRNANKYGDELYVSKKINNSHQLTGISIEKGVVTNVYETLTENSDYNVLDASTVVCNVNYLNYLSGLFESNKLVSDRLINFEFMFDDNTDVEQFELNTYYGLYLYSNPLTSSIYPYDKNNSGYLFKDINANDIDLSAALDSSTIDKSQLIYGYTSDDWFRRIAHNNDSSILDDIINKPGENILYTDGKRASFSNYISFFTFTLKEPLQAGEHIKIIFHNSSKSLEFNSIIYEIIFSDDNLYEDSILSNHIVTYNSNYKTKSHRISCYVKETDNISTQIKYIYNALKEINEGVFYIPSKTSDSLSICQIDNEDFDVYFQYISNSNSINKSNKLIYFSYYNPELFVLDPLTTINSSEKFECFLPIDFELLGKRVTSITKFIKIDSRSTPFEISTTISSDSNYLTDKLLISIDTSSNKNIKELGQFSLSNIVFDEKEWKSTDTFINVINSYNNIKNNIILLDSSLIGKAEQIDIYLYKPYYVNYVMCGILSTKQLDSYPNLGEFNLYNLSRLLEIYNEKDKNNVSYNYCNISPLVSSKYNWVANASIDTSHQIMLSIDNSIESKIIDTSVYINKFNNTTTQQDYREDLLNNNINISNFIYTLSSNFNILPLKTYYINKNTVEFLYNNVKYQLSSNNNELLSGKELSNCDIYMYNSINYSNKNEWEFFIDKQNKDILILHYINNNAKTYEITNITVGSPVEKNILKFDIYEKLFDLNINNNSLGITPANKIVVSENDVVIMYSPQITIIGDAHSNENNNIILSNIKISKSGFESGNEITASGGNEILNKFHINSIFECFLIQNEDINAVSLEEYKNNADITDLVAENANVYIKQNDAYNDYTTLQPLSITTIVDTNIDDSSVDDTSVDSSTLYQTVYTPYFYDIFEFSSPVLNDITVSDYNNLSVDSVNCLKNIWGIMYADNTDLCIKYNSNFDASSKEHQAPSFFNIEDYKPLLSSFGDYYHYYYLIKKKLKEDIIKGYKSGIVQKTYYNSLGLLFKNNNYKNIEISSWTNTYTKDNYIYYNVTYNVLNYILQSPGFIKIWNQNKITDENIKINFVKTTILPLISINTKNTITIFTKKSNRVNYSNSFISGMEENKNIKIELVNENDNIYAKLTPSNIANYTYYIKYNINL